MLFSCHDLKKWWTKYELTGCCLIFEQLHPPSIRCSFQISAISSIFAAAVGPKLTGNVRKVLPADENTRTLFPVAAHQIYWQAEEGKPQQQLLKYKLTGFLSGSWSCSSSSYFKTATPRVQDFNVPMQHPLVKNWQLPPQWSEAVGIKQLWRWGRNNLLVTKESLNRHHQGYFLSPHITSLISGSTFPSFQPRCYCPPPLDTDPLPAIKQSVSVHHDDGINHHGKLLNQWFSRKWGFAQGHSSEWYVVGVLNQQPSG